MDHSDGSPSLTKEINLLGDYTALRVLNCLVRRSSIGQHVADEPHDAREVESAASHLIVTEFPTLKEPVDAAHATYDASAQAAAVRALLVELTESDKEHEVHELLKSCLEDAERMEPEVADAGILLIAAGIVLLLQVEFDFRFEDGRVSFSAKKKATSDAIITKILSFFAKG
jgi:hypothetical protein